MTSCKNRSKVSFGVPPLKPSSSKVGASRPSCAGTSRTCTKKSKFNIPALSILPKTPPLDPVLEKLRKKTIRRNAPEGEDLKKIKEVIRGLQGEVVTVQEYVGLISPYTGDNGNVLRNVMGDDLSQFRRMAKRVYDTMTQDVSDVLANEQINLTEYYNERYTLFMDKMMRTIDEIFQYAPNFDFELYYENGQEYLDRLFPVKATSVSSDPEEEDMHRRQEAYHRLQWLRSEGTRLAEENEQLQTRLKELKRQQQDELISARKQEELAEVRKTHLEATQADLQNQLHELNESVEKSIILTEEELRLTDEASMKERRSRKPKPTSRSPPRQRGEPWNVRTAKVMEGESLVKSAKSAISSVSIVSTPSKGALKKKKPAKAKRPPPPQPQDKSPFHYSPVNSPPKPQQRELSPFHYSPSRSPSQRPSSPRGAPTTVRMETSTTVTSQAPQSQARQCPPSCPTGRRNLAPRDSWGGFG